MTSTPGSVARTLPEYVRALKALGVERYDSYLADGSASFHKSRSARANPKWASAPVQQFHTNPLWSRIF
jgi:hypothetical protein